MSAVPSEGSGPTSYAIVVHEQGDDRWGWRIVNHQGLTLCCGGADYSMRKSAIEAAENCVVSIRGSKVHRAPYLGGKPSYSARGHFV